MSLKNEHKFEIDKVKKELKAVKAKFYAQKKKCSRTIEPARPCLLREPSPCHPTEVIDSNKLQEAADAEKVRMEAALCAQEEVTKL